MRPLPELVLPGVGRLTACSEVEFRGVGCGGVAPVSQPAESWSSLWLRGSLTAHVVGDGRSKSSQIELAKLLGS